jgi:hypothetical protein
VFLQALWWVPTIDRGYYVSCYLPALQMVPEILYRVCYGTHDLSIDKHKAKLAASLSIKPAILHDYCRHRVERADYPGIVAEKGHTVRGTYVTGLTEHDIVNLDMFEGSEYRKRKVKVVLLKPGSHNDLVETGGEVQTETYVFTGGYHRLEKEEWDFEEFRKEKLHRWVDQSVEYEGKVLFPGHCGRMLTWNRGR